MYVVDGELSHAHETPAMRAQRAAGVECAGGDVTMRHQAASSTEAALLGHPVLYLDTRLVEPVTTGCSRIPIEGT